MWSESQDPGVKNKNQIERQDKEHLAPDFMKNEWSQTTSRAGVDSGEGVTELGANDSVKYSW